MKRLFLLLPLILSLTSCWDYSEPSEQNYVLGFGIDYENDKFILTVETVKITGEPTSLSAAEGVIIKSEGTTVSEAVDNAIIKSGKKLYWGHTELVILSENIVKNHLSAICDAISRSSAVYSNINLVVSKDSSAHDILTAKTPGGGMVSTHLANIFENKEASGNLICCELWQLQRDLPCTLVPVAVIDNYPKIDGSAIFNDRVFVGYLTGNETQIFALLENSVSGGKLPDITIDDISLSLEISSVKKEKETLFVTVTLLNSSAPYDILNPEKRKKVENVVSALISEQINSLILKPFGNPLSCNYYEVNATIKSSGLTKW